MPRPSESSFSPSTRVAGLAGLNTPVARNITESNGALVYPKVNVPDAVGT
jgi:hypothetical protein